MVPGSPARLGGLLSIGQSPVGLLGTQSPVLDPRAAKPDLRHWIAARPALLAGCNPAAVRFQTEPRLAQSLRSHIAAESLHTGPAQQRRRHEPAAHIPTRQRMRWCVCVSWNQKVVRPGIAIGPAAFTWLQILRPTLSASAMMPASSIVRTFRSRMRNSPSTMTDSMSDG